MDFHSELARITASVAQTPSPCQITTSVAHPERTPSPCKRKVEQFEQPKKLPRTFKATQTRIQNTIAAKALKEKAKRELNCVTDPTVSTKVKELPFLEDVYLYPPNEMLRIRSMLYA